MRKDGYALIAVLIIAVSMFSLVNGIFMLNHSRHRHNRQWLKHLQQRADRFNPVPR